MKIKEILIEGNKLLKDNHIEEETIICKLLLKYLLNKDNSYLVIHQDEEIDEVVQEQFFEFIDEIIQGRPVQYIVKNQEFMGLDFYVDENVLIPQPDTEVLVLKTVDICKSLKNSKKLKILDLCTGSGAIAIALAKILQEEKVQAEIFASDISLKALEVAKKNNEKNNTNVQFILSDLFQNIDEKFDIIVSNPPYIKTKVINTLSKQVQNEPKLALDGGEDGLDIYRKIINQALAYLNGYLCLEIGFDQKNEVTSLIKENKNYEKIESIKDFSGNDRCIICKKVR